MVWTMNGRILILWLALGLFVTGGCAAGPKVVTDFDPSVEFSSFRTFAFSGVSDRGREIGPSDHSPLRGRIKQMIDEQFAAKGVRQVGLEDHPDMLLHIFYGVKDELSVESSSRGPGFFARQVQAYEYHEGTWTPIKTTHVITHEDHEGTLILDFAKPSKKSLVGRAVIRAVLGDNLEENFKLANRGIAEAFKDYPSAK
jgi:hypothetical protein